MPSAVLRLLPNLAIVVKTLGAQPWSPVSRHRRRPAQRAGRSDGAQGLSMAVHRLGCDGASLLEVARQPGQRREGAAHPGRARAADVRAGRREAAASMAHW